MLYTKKGDDGFSSLYDTKKRLPKESEIFELLGTLDELNCWLGVCRASCNNLGGDNSELIKKYLEQAQENLFIIQAEVAGAKNELKLEQLQTLEVTIDKLDEHLGQLNSFYLPGGCLLSGFLDLTRTVARRCERVFLKATSQKALPKLPICAAYLNRLSSLLYTLARTVNQQKHIAEKSPHYGA